MRFTNISIGAALLLLAKAADALSILMNNDDGFGTANLRELKRLVQEDGHNVYIVAPATEQSGQGGRVEFTHEANLTHASYGDLIPKGAPSFGQDPEDDHVFYYNGTPAACTLVGLDRVFSEYANFTIPDLVITGPNYGNNLGPFIWTSSGTVGAAYMAIYRSVPAIAFSASDDKKTSYKDIHGENNPSTQAAKVAFKVFNAFIKDVPEGEPILPLGYGANVNIPKLTGKTNLTDLRYVQTRITGGAETNKAVWDERQGTFRRMIVNPKSKGLNACNEGDCNLENEDRVVEKGGVSISLFTTDYTAPDRENTKKIMRHISPLEEEGSRHE